MSRRAPAALLRSVALDGYRLDLWDTDRSRSDGKSLLGYRLSKGEGDTVFEGEDFGCSPLHAVDSDETVRALLGFLTLRPGDTDREYFAGYSARQWAFVESDAESLSLYACEELGMPLQDRQEGGAP